MARSYGEPPNQTRTKKYTKKPKSGRMTQAQRAAQRARGSNPFADTVRNVVDYYVSNPGQAVKDFVLASNPATVGSVVGYEVAKGQYGDAALTAAGVVPGVGGLGKVAKGASIVSKASKASKAAKAGTAAAKKATKAAAAKKTAKTAKAAKPTTTWKDRLPRPAQVSKPSAPKTPPSQVAKQRARGVKQFDEATGGRYKPGRPQPKRKNIKTDAPGTGGTSGNRTPVKKRELPYKADGPTNQTKAEVRQARQEKGATEREANLGSMTPDEVQNVLGRLGFKPKSSKSASEIVAERKPGAASRARKGSTKDEKAAQKSSADSKRSRTKRETEDIKRRGDEYRVGTPVEKTRRDIQVSRLRKSGAERPTATDPKFAGRKKDGSQALADIDVDLSGMNLSQLRSLRRVLEKRVRRGNANERTVQMLNEVREKLGTEGRTKSLMQSGIRSKGRGQPSDAPGAVNPPRNVKASNQKWRGEGGQDAPKGPRGKSGTPKRGDDAAMRAKEEDGVTRAKGKGGQRRRKVAPGQELVPPRLSARKPGTRARRTGGSSSSGSKPIALGSGRKAPSQEVVKGEVIRGGRNSGGGGSRTRTQERTGPRVRTEPIDLKTRPRGSGSSAASSGGRPKAIGRPRSKEVAVRGKGTVATRTVAAKAEKARKNRKGLAGKILGVGTAGAAVGGALYGLGQVGKGQDPKPTTKPTKPKKNLRDKYGREISREEYNKREAYRESLKGLSKAEQKKARKAEMARREEYRKGKGKRANTITRNLDIREGVSSRKVNREMKAAAGKSGNRQAAIEARKKYQRKKK